MENTQNQYLEKVKHIVPTFLLINIGSVITLLLFRWIFAIQFKLIDIKEEIWEIWIPMILPWLTILILLRPRLRILAFKKEADNRRFFFQIISWIAMAMPLVFSQTYLTTAVGKLENLYRIEDIGKKPDSRYYKVQQFKVATYFGCSYVDVRTSGKHNNYLNFDVFFTAPIMTDTSIRFTDIPLAWYGVKYMKQISNRISDAEKESAYRAFIAECLQKIENYTYSVPDHFENIPTSDDRKNFLKAIEQKINRTPDRNLRILIPANEPYAARNGNKLLWLFSSFVIGLAVLLFSLIWPGYSATEHRKFIKKKKPKEDDLVDLLKYLIPSGGHFITSIIVDVNIIVFIVMVFSGVDALSPNGLELLDWGANRRLEVMNGEWWRIVTNIFVHGGIMHLLLNIYGLVIGAVFMEPILGRKNYLILYLLSGIFASLASMLWHENTSSVGASGAIFGLYGAILALLLTDAFGKDNKKGILIFIGVYVVVNLAWGLTGGIDNAAHIGGLVSGALIGPLLYQFSKKVK